MSLLRYLGLLVAAFAGGYVAQFVQPTSAVSAADKDGEFQTLTARTFELHDKTGGKKAALFNTKEGGASFVMYDSNGSPRVLLSTLSTGSPVVQLFDGSKSCRASMELDAKGWGNLLIRDQKGNPVWIAPDYAPAQQGQTLTTEKDRWSSLRKGMSQEEVLRLLGNPQVAEFGGKGLRWVYGVRGFSGVGGAKGDGSVSFDQQGLVSGWSSPFDGK